MARTGQQNVAPATQEEVTGQQQQDTTDERRKGTPIIKDTETLKEHRQGLATLLGDVARTRDNAARLNAQARDAYAALDPVTLAFHYSNIALELFREYPKARKDARFWGSIWGSQMNLLAIEVFEDTNPDDAAKLRGRFGVDASKYATTFFYVPEVVEPWSKKQYGVQPKSLANLSSAYQVARNVKQQRAQRSDVQIRKMWSNLRKRFGSTGEMARFVNIALEDIKAMETDAQESSAPAAPQPIAATA